MPSCPNKHTAPPSTSLSHLSPPISSTVPPSPPLLRHSATISSSAPPQRRLLLLCSSTAPPPPHCHRPSRLQVTRYWTVTYFLILILSRICVKNLPKHATEERIRDYFSQKGEVTDAKLMRTRDGKSRQFGFVGFRTEKEAAEALKFFHGSFMDTYRLTCEIARQVGDSEMPRPWSRHSLKKQEKPTMEKKESVKSSKKVTSEPKNDTENGDLQFQEFLQVMQPRTKSKLWSNDMLEATQEKDGNKKVQLKEGKPKLNSESDKVNEIGDKSLSDMDYFKSRVKKDWSDSDADDVEEAENDDDDGEIEKIDDMNPENPNETDDVDEPSSSLEDEDDVLQTGRLFVRNLPYTASEDDLREHFSKFGSVSEVHLVVDRDTKRSKGIAYILYALPESAARALEELDNSIFQGRLLHIMPAKQKVVPVKKDEFDHQAKTFKQQREEKRKKSEISGDTRAWNSLFMRPDTVVENIAREFGTSKSELLDREASDVAVRIALAETQVVAKTKKALANAGVNVTSLENFASKKTESGKRSNHVILVKNLPYGSSESELATMFGKFGSIDKVILPSTKTLGLVVFLEPGDARAAFKCLAYKRYKDAPLYLEWAPDDILSGDQVGVTDEKETPIVGEQQTKRALLEQQLEGTDDADIDTERVESRSLFVKNLNFKTTDESLKKHFVEHIKEGKLRSVRIKKHMKNGKNVSMGFGFLEFDTVDTAVHVCRDLQGTVLDGHALILQLCHVKNNDRVKEKVGEDQSSTKLIVRNVAFEATEKELRQLFSPFGQVKSLRLPTRFGKHRGFAFVEYVTKQETKTALQALSNTHLYGRHLVLERAKEGESLEELRARTAAQFVDESTGFQNQTKLSLKRKQLDI
ncbi:putative RNA recognition motif domain, nucleotide-binding alpha-beta plait domain superfamily [Helianthus annuus]|uniref:RNA recognition motif domain, nucleotide-binding alpha-beta plait domain superfamily n=1 Tax=Helianthus annuus TaxID=4232 RepID=A0A9K3JA75_HELAN|nr:putative RNA recognition motif domain, nucleotide-binding alpha-beta plait domain superfamily [Helianthus annuus]KAJ0581908.1 putative RNA recognition motif domain, nucleotide-binding alpha-beta plait domain superfamily [Helianthus annuus]KAJ0758520.1 putative RNA recognition motif domain, nucleotide-binding alpha-beta plait domain superfamily [Helianthus annuus]KAJ0932351.1 putative RNA recognition motif domain, nucleotide-binding alpha-beta plait domain superfamily [Helianthus annuus]